MTPARQLAIMVKAPRVGCVKTRLGRGIGRVPAWTFYRLVSRTLIGRLSPDPRWTTNLAVTPDRHAAAGQGFPAWPGGINRVAQGPGDLGARMGHVLQNLGPGPVVIIGADIPDISRRHVWRAFRALDSHDAVIGPATDGGYWLIGLGRGPAPRGFLNNIRWSSRHAFGDTLRSLGPGARVATLDCLRDIDTAEDLEDWKATGRRLSIF